MEKSESREVWLRGPIPGILPQLQPVAHALLQAQEEIRKTTALFPSELLWEKPAGVASVAFHLQHIRGVLDRLFTYAKGEQLSIEQLKDLKAEGERPQTEITTEALLAKLDNQFQKVLDELRTLEQHSLLEERGVGRAQLPSTTIGLIFHAAEHTMRHVGQLLVTVKVLKENLK